MTSQNNNPKIAKPTLFLTTPTEDPEPKPQKVFFSANYKASRVFLERHD